MQQMTIKIIANFIHKGKRKELTEEVSHLIQDPPQKKDTSKLANMIKKLFETELNRTCVVKLRVKKSEVTAKVEIRPTREEEEAIKE